MAISRVKALEYADSLIAVPRSHVLVKLRQSKGAVTLLHGRRVLTKCYLNRSGLRVALYMARALGVKVPPLGQTVEANVSTGVLWRAVSISCLNLRKKESHPLLQRLLEEAEMQRGGTADEL